MWMNVAFHVRPFAPRGYQQRRTMRRDPVMTDRSKILHKENA